MLDGQNQGVGHSPILYMALNSIVSAQPPGQNSMSRLLLKGVNVKVGCLGDRLANKRTNCQRDRNMANETADSVWELPSSGSPADGYSHSCHYPTNFKFKFSLR